MKTFSTLAAGIVTATAALVSGSCSCSNDPSHVSARVLDRKAYALGQQHAARVVELRCDEPRLQDALLDNRARITNIRARLGAQSAADFSRGFTDYITEHDDSLARVLF